MNHDRVQTRTEEHGIKMCRVYDDGKEEEMAIIIFCGVIGNCIRKARRDVAKREKDQRNFSTSPEISRFCD